MFIKVDFKVLALILLISVVFAYDLGYTHSGRTDANGGHYNRRTGEYHYHDGGRSRPQVNESPAAPAPLPESLNGAEVQTSSSIEQDHVGKVSRRRSELRLAAWSIRILSDRSRDNNELNKIAQTLIDYDFIAVSELRDEKVLKRIQKILSELGAEYGYLMSDPVGREGSPHRERYAFLYYKGLVSVVKDGKLYLDAADGKDDFVRDPYWATFRAGRFDFSVVVVHVVWGDRVADRQAEVMELAKVYEYVQEANGTEDDVLLVGDFNRDPSDRVAYSSLMAIPSMTQLFQLPQKSHIRDSSLYDNIFFQKDYVTEYLGSSGIDRFDETDFGNDDGAANLAVSDHRPVWAVFSINRDDDDSGTSIPVSVLGQDSESAEPEPELSDEKVYVTRSGKKYHRDGCSSLRRSKIEVLLAGAKQDGYTACRRCNPPR